MTDLLEPLEFIGGRLAVSVPADDADSAAAVWDAGEGTALPSLAAADFPDARELVSAVEEVSLRVPIFSIALGGGADPRQWEKVLRAGEAGAKHLNQPFSTASFVKGRLPAAWVNGVVEPGPQGDLVQLLTIESPCPALSAREASHLLSEGKVDALKVHPTDATEGFRGTLEAARRAAEAGFEGFEPAGGLDLSNLPHLAELLLEIPRIKVIPHVFSAVRSTETGKVDPRRVRRLVEELRAVAS